MQKLSASSNANRDKQAYSKATKEGIAILKDEIQLAFQWQRPSILLAIQKSKLDLLKNQLILEQELIKTNKLVKWLNVDKKAPDIIAMMGGTPDRNRIVFFVSGLGNTENAESIKIYNALNLHRELLVEQNIRVIFWLTELEAANLPYYAPDFWAFRHRVIEFAPRHGTNKNPTPAGLLLWKDQIPYMYPEELKSALEHTEKKLGHLPKEKPGIAIHAQTLLAASHYSWLLNDSQKFTSYLGKASELSQKYALPSMQAWVLNSKGIGLYETGQKNEASSLFKQALDYDSGNSIFKMNISITNHSMGKRSDAITTGKQAIKQDPNNPRLWNVLGYLYLSTGKTENAIESIKRAQFIEPDNILTYYSLAICYYKDGQLDTCAEEIRKIQKFPKEHDVVQSACISIMTGKANEAYTHLKQSIKKSQILKQQILRDPNLQILLKPHEKMIFN